jgi:molecular chaperone Hsp33
MLVIKHDADKELYRGISPIDKTSFEGALGEYLCRSQQTLGFVRIETPIDTDGRVERATGLLVERLPGTSDEAFEEHFGGLRKASLVDVLAEARRGCIAGGTLEVLSLRQVEFRCTCSPDRARHLLAGVGPQEISEILEDPGFAELTCNFCGEVFVLAGEQLIALRDAALAPEIDEAK